MQCVCVFFSLRNFFLQIKAIFPPFFLKICILGKDSERVPDRLHLVVVLSGLGKFLSFSFDVG